MTEEQIKRLPKYVQRYIRSLEGDRDKFLFICATLPLPKNPDEISNRSTPKWRTAVRLKQCVIEGKLRNGEHLKNILEMAKYWGNEIWSHSETLINRPKEES